MADLGEVARRVEQPGRQPPGLVFSVVVTIEVGLSSQLLNDGRNLLITGIHRHFSGALRRDQLFSPSRPQLTRGQTLGELVAALT